MSSFKFKLNAPFRRTKGKVTNITLLLMLVLEIKNPIYYKATHYLPDIVIFYSTLIYTRQTK